MTSTESCASHPFACAGAEIYDGFFRAQLNPPGANSQKTFSGIGVTTSPDRDGEWIDPKPQNQHTYPPQEPQDHFVPKLLRSQLNASVGMLCDGDIASTQEKKTYHHYKLGIGSRIQFGEFSHAVCNGSMKSPNIVLMSFGGNDFAFSSVVKWAPVPDTARKVFLAAPRQLSLDLTRYLLEVDDLKIVPGKVYAYVYPNPFPEKDDAMCQARLGAGNEALGQYVRDIGERNPYLIGNPLKGWLFTVKSKDANLITKSFIVPLQKAQGQSIKRQGWNALESQRGFESSSGGRSMCAVSPQCSTSAGSMSSQCIADIYAWAIPSGAAQPFPLLRQADNWDPYDSRTMRGLRTANDAVLTQATFDTDDHSAKINKDWMSGMVHPAATVHSGIATFLGKCDVYPSLCRTTEQLTAAH